MWRLHGRAGCDRRLTQRDDNRSGVPAAREAMRASADMVNWP